MYLVFRELNKDYNLGSFNDFFRHIILDPPESLDDATMKRYDAALKKFQKFNPSITTNDIACSMIERCEYNMPFGLPVVPDV